MQRANAPSLTAQYFRGVCTASETIGKVVYISGDQVGDAYPVRTADPYEHNKMPGMGIVVRKYTDTDCLVQRKGEIHDVFSGLEYGKTYKVSDTGDLQRLPPAAGGGGFAYVQFMGYAMDDAVFFVEPEFKMTIRI